MGTTFEEQQAAREEYQDKVRKTKGKPVNIDPLRATPNPADGVAEAKAEEETSRVDETTADEIIANGEKMGTHGKPVLERLADENYNQPVGVPAPDKVGDLGVERVETPTTNTPVSDARTASHEEASRLNAEAVETEEEDASDEPSPPAKSASKGEWVEFAVSQGMKEEEAEAKTQKELVAQYLGE